MIYTLIEIVLMKCYIIYIQYIIVSHEESGSHGEQEVTSQTSVSEDEKAFCQLFSLPDTESPVTGKTANRYSKQMQISKYHCVSNYIL